MPYVKYENLISFDLIYLDDECVFLLLYIWHMSIAK